MKKKQKNTSKKISFLKKIKNFIQASFYLYIVHPIQERRKANKKKKYDKLVKFNFEKTFNVDVEEVKAIMYFDKNANSKKMNDFLLEGRQGTYCGGNSPLFFNPEICDIHNENLNNPELIPYDELIKKESEISKKLLKQQSMALDMELASNLFNGKK